MFARNISHFSDFFFLSLSTGLLLQDGLILGTVILHRQIGFKFTQNGVKISTTQIQTIEWKFYRQEQLVRTEDDSQNSTS